MFKIFNIPVVSGPLLVLLFLFAANSAHSTGEIGDHVNDLKPHIDDYSGEVNWLIGKFGEMTAAYGKGGVDAVDTMNLVDYWEEVDFHEAIETTHIPLYALIWQGLYGVKGAMEQGDSADVVAMRLAEFERALWQALGAVKFAAELQVRDKQAQTAPPGEQVQPMTFAATLDEIDDRLDQVGDKYETGAREDAIDLVHATYANLFEGIEGALIEQDAGLVEVLEKDFNVTLPLALEADANLEQVEAVLESMAEKLERAEELLEKAERERKDVF